MICQGACAWKNKLIDPPYFSSVRNVLAASDKVKETVFYVWKVSDKEEDDEVEKEVLKTNSD